MERFTIELTVSNSCGVLNRITGVYAKGKQNIDALTVQESPDPELSVVQIVSRGDEALQWRMVRQLGKLFDVKTALLLNDTNLSDIKEK